MPPWRIQLSETFLKCLRRYKADKAVFRNCRRFIEDLSFSDNPASLGIPKKGQYGGCLGTHITKSVVLVYSVDYARHKIDLIKIGDHKMVYGSDG